ncbi:MAG: glycosyltransferase family 4 protein [Hyphomicrobiaceae bacterium]
MRLLIATDAWHPQVNGVVTTLTRMQEELPRQGVCVSLVTPEQFATLPLPGYRSIKVAWASVARLGQQVKRARPDWIHIATEGPIGWAMRRYCLAHKQPFTTSYHTKFPEYAAKIVGLPTSWFYAFERRFHAKSAGVMVATASLEADLQARGFRNLLRWSRGVDLDLFHRRDVRLLGEGPVFLYVGRISREKNIEAFLRADLPGRKVVVGDGPHLSILRNNFPEVLFTGAKHGIELAELYASADVFVFPSRTDTFGLVVLEAMASGLPVAAYPVTGPVDIVENGLSGILDEDLTSAARRALSLKRNDACRRAAEFSWTRSAKHFCANIRAARAASDAPRSNFFQSSHMSRLRGSGYTSLR